MNTGPRREPDDAPLRRDAIDEHLGTGPDDEALSVELADLLHARSEPPAEVLSAAREIYSWRTLDAELAALTFDSLIDVEPSPSRSAVRTRSLTFEAGGLTIELEIDTGPDGRRLVGQLVPPQIAQLQLRRDDEILPASSDEMGRFTLALAAGVHRISLLCRLIDGTEVVSASALV